MSGESLKKLRIFVASPGDVANERARLKSIVEDLNNGLANHLGIVIELKEWSQVAPNIGRGQQVIFDLIPVTTWDLMIGILWLRYGTPSGGANPAESGTHEEFNAAYEMWKQTDKPRIMFYRCTRSPEDITKLNLDDLTKINQFFKGFETGGKHEGLYRSYDTAENFERLVRNHITDFIVEYSEQVEHKTVTPETLQVYAPVIPNNLPRRQAFFGRTKEMEIAMRALGPDDRTWGVLVDGIGGIGKSAIAIEAAHLSQEKNLFDAFVFVTAKTNILEPSGIKELNPPARTLDEFLNETARVLGQPGIAKLTGNEKRRALIEVIRSMHTLLIYDNLETLSKDEQEGIADFLRELPQGCKAIITSRRRGGEGGVWLRVEKLDWDAAHGIIENQMSLDVGLANKLNRVGEVRWQEIFDETNGSPLALVHVLGLMRVRAALTFDGALEMLRGNRNEDLQKFIFQEAQKELTKNDKAALGALSFFAPSATFEAWMDVAELSRNALETTIDRLSALSLVDALIGEERYALHPLTRAFVRDELLDDARVKFETGMLFARYWTGYAERYSDKDKESSKTYYLFEKEWHNLDEATSWLWETSNVQGKSIANEDAARLFGEMEYGLRWFLWYSGRWDRRIQVLMQSYEIAYAMNRWTKAGWCAYRLAWTYMNRADVDNATIWADQCAQMGLLEGSKALKAYTLMIQGQIAQYRLHYAKASSLLLQALTLLRDVGFPEDIARVLHNLGELARATKDFDESAEYYMEGVKSAQAIQSKELEVLNSTGFGQLALDRKQWAEAQKQFAMDLPVAIEVGRQDLIAYIRYSLACAYEATGRTDLALPLAQEAFKIYEQLQHRDLAVTRELVERLKKTGG